MNNPTHVPTQLDFAREVRAERLSLLWKVTIAGSLFLVWGMLILTSFNVSPLSFFVPVALIIGGCLVCRWLLSNNRYESAVWTYTAGLVAGLTIMMYNETGRVDSGREMVAFLLPLVIVIVGFLMPARATLPVLLASVAATLIVPSIGRDTLIPDRVQIFAIVIMALAAGAAAQMSGALYGIAEWALESYRKERETKGQLFDSQQEVQRSYLRQKALADQLQETNKELEAARTAAIEAKNFRGQFLANMSHELRTPLNAIIGFSETMLKFPMMYDNQPLPPIYRNDLNQIYTSGKHLLQLINDILDLSKVDAGKLDLEVERVELEPIFQSALATGEGLVAEKRIMLNLDAPDKLPQVRGDSLRIRQVLLNLLSNAAKFTDEGAITIGASCTDAAEIVIWIKDSGIGIPPQDMDKIFEEFRQGSSGRRKGRAGSGLGLAISRQLLNLMGGRIWAESVPGQGSIFYFTLPIYTVEPAVEQQG
ncbi:MAG: HAMP domain-containing histidine kinase [Anaerolineae bacterium]|nr:HAMP domain-containing histidine kinase [Anaerolineae bacterium]